MARFVAKAVLIGGLVLAVSLPVTAQQIDFPDENSQYWKNAEPTSEGEQIEEFTARCPDTIRSIEVGGSPVSGVDVDSKDEVRINSGDLSGFGEAGSLDVQLACQDNPNANAQLEIATLDYSIDDSVGRYDSTEFGQGLALPSDPPMRTPVLNVSANGGNVDVRDTDLEFDSFGNAFEGRDSNREIIEDTSSDQLRYRLFPHDTGDQEGIYSADLVYRPSSREQVRFELKDATDDSEPPKVELFDNYRVSSVSSTLSEGSFQSYDSLEDLTYGFRLTENGEPVTPESDDPPQRKGYVLTTVETVDELGEDGEEYAEYVEKNWFSRPTYEGNGRWNTTIDNSPVLEAGLYRFVTELRVPSTGRTVQLGEIFVERDMDFNGKVVDSSSSRNSIDATFRFFDGGTKESDFSTSPDGTYTSRVERKDYDSVEMEFYDERSRSSATESFDARVTASDVTVGDSQGSVRFDYLRDPSVSIPGISPVNMMAAQFGYDLGDVSEIEMAYDSGSVSVGEAQVFECNNWNYFAQSCQSEWESLDEDDYDVNPVSEQVSITGAEPYVLPQELSGSRNSQRILKSAYVVGTASSLELDGDIDVSAQGGRVPAGNEFSVSGDLVTEGGSPVENADVSVNLSIGKESYGSVDGKTDANGRFSLEIQSPSTPGNYSISVSANKQPFDPVSRRFEKSLTSYVSKGVEVSLPGGEGGQLSLVKGRKTTEDIKVKNTGQRPVEDVSVSVSDLNEDFFNMSSATLDDIDTGDTASVQMDILVPNSFGLDQFPSFTVSVEGESGGDRVSSQTEVFTVINQVTDVSTDDEADNRTEEAAGSETDSPTRAPLGSFIGSAPSLDSIGPTGNFVEGTSNINLALGLVFVFLLVVAGAVKKNKSSGSDRSRISHDRPAVTSVDGSSGLSTQAAQSPATPREPDDAPTEMTEGSGASMEGDVCGECGEEFDTGVALEMHQETAH